MLNASIKSIFSKSKTSILFDKIIGKNLNLPITNLFNFISELIEWIVFKISELKECYVNLLEYLKFLLLLLKKKSI